MIKSNYSIYRTKWTYYRFEFPFFSIFFLHSFSFFSPILLRLFSGNGVFFRCFARELKRNTQTTIMNRLRKPLPSSFMLFCTNILTCIHIKWIRILLLLTISWVFFSEINEKKKKKSIPWRPNMNIR